MIDPSWYQRPEGTPEHLTAGGVVIRSEADGLLVALVREGDYPAYILPKGRVEPGESLVQAAIREIAEEAGLTGLEYLGYLGTQERLNYGKNAWKVIHYFLFQTERLSGSPTDLSHDYRCEWYPIDHLPDMFWPEQKELIDTNRGKIEALVKSRAS